MMAEYQYEEAVRKFASARSGLEAVQAEIAQHGSNLERMGRLKWGEQAVAQAEKDLAAKIKAWEACKEKERSPDETD